MSEYIYYLFIPEVSLSSTSTAILKPTVIIVPDAYYVLAYYVGLVSFL